MLDKLFPKKVTDNRLFLHLNTDFKQSIEVEDQEVGKYLTKNNEDKQYNILLIIKNKKTSTTVLKRKLNKYQKFSQALATVDVDHVGYLVMGYDDMKQDLIRTDMSPNKVDAEPGKFIRSGLLFKFSRKSGTFQQCQFRLHPDYLLYFKIKKKDKLSYMALDNASVQVVDQSKYIFSINQKYKTMRLKSQSKQDMRGWLLSITDAIRLKYQQRYVNNLNQKVAKHQIDKIKKYHQQSKMLVEQEKLLLSDAKGRAALSQYFKKNYDKQEVLADVKVLNLINNYHHYCSLLRQQAKEAKQFFIDLKAELKAVSQYLKSRISVPLDKVLDSQENNYNTDVYKLFQSISYYMGVKYHSVLYSQRYLHSSILNYAVKDYKTNNKIHMMSILCKNERNKT